MSAIIYLLAGDLVHIKKLAKGTTGGATDEIEYIAYALPGTNESDEKWFIKKLIYDGAGFQTDELFAEGTANFDKSWALKDSYSYL